MPIRSLVAGLLVALAVASMPSAFAFTTLNAVSPLRLSSSFKEEGKTEEVEKPQGNPWLSLNTRGGAIVWTTVLLVLPFLAYGPIAAAVGDELQAGRIIAGVYSLGVVVLWTGSYFFRVGTKDMTYGKQLKAYEDAVIAKRFEELQEDEVEALLTDLEPPGDGPTPPKIRGSGWRPDQY